MIGVVGQAISAVATGLSLPQHIMSMSHMAIGYMRRRCVRSVKK